jgi:phage tail-like protein
MPQSYPLPRFSFEVVWGGTKISFTEVTGLVMERDKIEFRFGNDKNLHKRVMPGLPKALNLVLKSGVFENDTEFSEWYEQVSDDRSGQRHDVIVTLVDEKRHPVAAWKAARCFPLKVSAPDLKSDANEIAIETVELVHEGLSYIDI